MSPEEVKRVRLELGLTQEGFAREIGITYAAVNRWETGKSKPSPLAIVRIQGLIQKHKGKK